MRQEVTAIEGENVTIRTTTVENGKEKQVFERTFKKKDEFDPATQARSRGEKVIGTGKSQVNLNINGREYKCECRWYSFHFTVDGKEELAETKVWISADAPVYGMVKSQTEARGKVTSSMELTDSVASSKR